MAIAELAVESRTGCGKGFNRKLRQEGKIPAVRYGRQCSVSLLAVDRFAMERLLVESGGSLVSLKLDGAGADDEFLSIVKDVQRDPVSGRLIHADFYGVRYGEPILVEVPIAFTGKAKGVAEGGLLQPVRRSLEIKCLPRKIPENITIDVSDLGLGEAIHVNDLEVEDVEFVASVNFTIVTVQSVSGGASDEAEEAEVAEVAEA